MIPWGIKKINKKKPDVTILYFPGHKMEGGKENIK